MKRNKYFDETDPSFWEEEFKGNKDTDEYEYEEYNRNRDRGKDDMSQKYR